ncbi:tyrosine-type recombinase/integrase [Anaerobium acetethylicum]|uniref:Site-specific recombinase XerD n=1 Tax=Anaerobium acetethylicum TaxID=1619234 RepID=A0A1D3TZJ7_9FIRM|nr:tyrosine-type recombinase/integrase [Anaerobium acetethylicum]SCP99999.1 Site-specific recombinase XerD [Anaerobium acetethylicum]HOO91699.1 tyrosine-type recombinase/integrase [Syntrophales bacterium]
MNEANTNYLKQHIDILSFRDLAPGTVSTYTSYMTQFIDWTEAFLSGKPLSAISWVELRSYIRYLKEIRELNPRTVNVHIAQLRDFYHYVLHRDWDRYQIPYLRYDELLPRVPSKAEVNTIIDSVYNPKHKAELALLYSSGIRVSELCRLRCGDIYHSKHCIYISKSKNRSDRYAVLAEKAYDLLPAYIREFYPDAKKEDWLFPGQKPGSHICEQSVYTTFKNKLTALGWSDSGYTLHSLRHGFGLHLYEDGADLMSIKEAMGHKSLSSTSVYLTLGIGNGRSVTSPYDV